MISSRENRRDEGTKPSLKQLKPAATEGKGLTKSTHKSERKTMAIQEVERWWIKKGGQFYGEFW